MSGPGGFSDEQQLQHATAAAEREAIVKYIRECAACWQADTQVLTLLANEIAAGNHHPDHTYDGIRLAIAKWGCAEAERVYGAETVATALRGKKS